MGRKRPGAAMAADGAAMGGVEADIAVTWPGPAVAGAGAGAGIARADAGEPIARALAATRGPRPPRRLHRLKPANPTARAWAATRGLWPPRRAHRPEAGESDGAGLAGPRQRRRGLVSDRRPCRQIRQRSCR